MHTILCWTDIYIRMRLIEDSSILADDLSQLERPREMDDLQEFDNMISRLRLNPPQVSSAGSMIDQVEQYISLLRSGQGPTQPTLTVDNSFNNTINSNSSKVVVTSHFGEPQISINCNTTSPRNSKTNPSSPMMTHVNSTSF